MGRPRRPQRRHRISQTPSLSLNSFHRTKARFLVWLSLLLDVAVVVVVVVGIRVYLLTLTVDWSELPLHQNDLRKQQNAHGQFPLPRVIASQHHNNKTSIAVQEAVRVVVVVLSARSHVARRNVIRDTWGQRRLQQQTCSPVYFIVGAPCPKMHHADDWMSCDEPETGGPSSEDHQVPNRQQISDEINSLRQEQGQHQDLLQISTPESYRSLPYKVSGAYQFVDQHYPSVEWVVKVDDDMFVRLHSLTTYLQQLSRHSVDENHLATTTAARVPRPMVVGCIRYASFVLDSGKWGEDHYFTQRDDPYYPPYAMGSCGHAVSRPVIQYIATRRARLHHYRNEDTSIGIWCDQSDMNVTFVVSKVFHNERQCEQNEFYVVGHGLSLESIRSCFDRTSLQQESLEDVERRAVTALQGLDRVEVRDPLVTSSDQWRKRIKRKESQGATALRLDNFRRGYGGRGP